MQWSQIVQERMTEITALHTYINGYDVKKKQLYQNTFFVL